MDKSTWAYACAMNGVRAGRRIREAVHSLPLAERAQPCTSRLKPGGNVRADQVGEEIGIKHLETLSADLGLVIQLLIDGSAAPLTIGSSASKQVVWAYFDAIDGTIKVAGIARRSDSGRLRAANDGGWASAMAFTAPTEKPLVDLAIGDFVVAAIVDGNPPRHATYPPEVIAVPGALGLETYDVSSDEPRRVFTTTIEELSESIVFLDGFQAFDRLSALPGDETLAVELYRTLINRNEVGGAYDVLRQYSNLNALQRMMLGWRDEPTWYESQGAAFIALNENLTNLIPAVPIIEGAGGISVGFDDRPIRERKIADGRASVVHAANERVRAAVLAVVKKARRKRTS